jgi:hypothetical protein
MQLTKEERQIVKICVEELESTLGGIPPREADVRVALVAKVLRGFIVEREE